MDHRKFDRLTRLFGAPRSRRTALRALLGAALLGATTRPALATPCGTGKHDFCGNRDSCCPGRCFKHELCENVQLCCTGPDLIICGDKTTGEPTCCQKKGNDPCGDCMRPELPAGKICGSYVGGSYRRR
jgi:hypothetical protein